MDFKEIEYSIYTYLANEVELDPKCLDLTISRDFHVKGNCYDQGRTHYKHSIRSK